jgi:cysteinyl-tRNA synthetase
VGSADLHEMLHVIALDNLLTVAVAEAPGAVRALLERRERARADRDYAEADQLRDQIRAEGWEVRDGPEGPELIPAS